MVDVKKLLLKILSTMSDVVVYKTNVTTTVTSSDGYAEYLYASSLGMDNVLDRYLWVASGIGWNQRPMVQEAASNRLTIRTWATSTPANATVNLLRNTHVTLNIVGILKPDYWGGVVRKLLNSLITERGWAVC